MSRSCGRNCGRSHTTDKPPQQSYYLHVASLNILRDSHGSSYTSHPSDRLALILWVEAFETNTFIIGGKLPSLPVFFALRSHSHTLVAWRNISISAMRRSRYCFVSTRSAIS